MRSPALSRIGKPRFAMSAGWKRYCLVSLGLFGLFWLALAIAPNDRADWALENVLVLLFVPALLGSMRWLPSTTMRPTTLAFWAEAGHPGTNSAATSSKSTTIRGM